MKIILLCEGDTEKVLKPALKRFMDDHAADAGTDRVGLDIRPFKGNPDCDQIRTRLELHAKKSDVLAVIALLDVYPHFKSAVEVKAFMRNCVKNSEFADRFHPHAAQYEFEAWLLPFWGDLCRRLKVDAKPPGADPEKVDDQKPPSHHLKDLYRKARSRGYEKVIEAGKILGRHRIEDAAKECLELSRLLDTLVNVCKQASK